LPRDREGGLTGQSGRRTFGAYAVLIAVMQCAPMLAAVAAPTAETPTVQLSIGGGAVDSGAYRWSSALAETLSRPPGLPECDPSTPCGVTGVIAGAQTYDTTEALVGALSEGRIATAVVPALSLCRLRCDAAKGQTAPAISTLKVLYRQPLYLVVRGGTTAIAKPADWIKKTVTVGIAGSDSEVLTLALLDAYRIPRTKLKLLRLPPAASVDAMRKATANVGVFLGHVFDTQVGELIGKGFTLMSLPDTPERVRLLQSLPVFEASAIPPGAFPGLPAISNLAQPVVWAAGPNLDPAVAGKLVAAMSEPHNQSRIAELVDPVKAVPEGVAFSHLPVPLSEGVRRFALSEHIPIDVMNCPSAAGQIAGTKQP
jgi:TRAP-type uncharacterized transport system substrate-binding protein